MSSNFSLFSSSGSTKSLPSQEKLLSAQSIHQKSLEFLRSERIYGVIDKKEILNFRMNVLYIIVWCLSHNA